jgi:hypothetical protein
LIEPPLRHPDHLHGSCRSQSKLLTVEVCVVSSIQWIAHQNLQSSGTSYTMNLVHSVANVSLATNYVSEAKGLPPVFKDQSQGPFWLHTGGENSGPGYLLTKVSSFDPHCFSGIIKLKLKTCIPHAYRPIVEATAMVAVHGRCKKLSRSFQQGVPAMSL